MEQLIQEQGLYQPKNNKAIVGLVFGLISLSSWGAAAIAGRITGDYRAIPISIFAFGILALIGIIFSIMGFRSRKILSVIAIVACVLGILPSFVIFNLMSSVGIPLSDLVPNQTYKEANFSIDIPSGWEKLDLTSKAKDANIRVLFMPKQNSELFTPRIDVRAIEIGDTYDFNSFAQGEEAAIKNMYNFIAGKTITLQSGSFYQIDYTLNEKGNITKARELLTVKNGVGYIITTESLESSYQKYLPEFTKTFISFKLF